MMVHTSWITSLWPPSCYHMDVEMEATVQRAVELGGGMRSGVDDIG